MKGIVFTEFSEMVEQKFGLETLDNIITKSGASGSYTSIGTYPHSEMVNLVVALSEETSTPIGSLLEAFGSYLFSSFTRMYPQFFQDINDPFDFLENVENYIHSEVLKIYPRAQLPSIDAIRENEQSMRLVYKSDRRMSDLAVGLVKGCLKHFGEDADIEKVIDENSGAHVEFRIQMK